MMKLRTGGIQTTSATSTMVKDMPKNVCMQCARSNATGMTKTDVKKAAERPHDKM